MLGIVSASDDRPTAPRSRREPPPFRLVGHKFAIARAAPEQGEHSAEILREAGFSAEEIADLAASGTITGPRNYD